MAKIKCNLIQIPDMNNFILYFRQSVILLKFFPIPHITPGDDSLYHKTGVFIKINFLIIHIPKKVPY